MQRHLPSFINSALSCGLNPSEFDPRCTGDIISVFFKPLKKEEDERPANQNSKNCSTCNAYWKTFADECRAAAEKYVTAACFPPPPTWYVNLL